MLLTGGSGFIGGHVARALIADGHELRVLLRRTSDTRFIDDLAFEPVIGDLREPASLHAACRGVDVVVHAAAVLRAVDTRDFMLANREGTAALADAAASSGVERFIYISSIAAQGPAPSPTPEPPDTQTHPVSAYGRSKEAGEQALLQRRGRMQIAILRPPMVYGPRDTGLQAFFWMAKRGLSVRLGEGKNLVDAIYGPDLAEAIAALLRSTPRQLARYHVCDTGGPYDWNQLLATLGEAAERRLWIPTLAPAMFHGLARASELWATVTQSEPTLDRARVVEMRQPAWICDPTSLIDDTGWRPQTGLLEGMRLTMAWYRKHGWV